MIKKLTILALAFCAFSSAHALKIPGLGGGGGGASIGAVFDEYVFSYSKALSGNSLIAEALGLHELAGELKAEAGKLEKGDVKLKAVSKVDKAGQAKIEEKLSEAEALGPEKKELVVEGSAEYAQSAISLAALVSKVQNLERPSLAQMGQLHKFRALGTLPGYVKRMANIIPQYRQLMEKNDIPPPPAMSEAGDALGSF
mgnify:CR=1 FL=1|jgi:hypothetical protein